MRDNRNAAASVPTAGAPEERTAGNPEPEEAHGSKAGKIGAGIGNGKGKERRPAEKRSKGDEEGAGGRNREAMDSDVEIEEDDDSTDMRDPSLRPDHRYYAVRSQLANSQFPRKLNPKMKTVQKKDDGFMIEGDERWYRNYNYSSIERTVNVSCSFSYNGECITCLHNRHSAWQGRNGEPIVMVATDHHFPPTFQWTGKGNASGSCVWSQAAWTRLPGSW
jgi:hypothetical protein